MYRLNAPPPMATAATNFVLANDSVFLVGQADGAEVAATLAATPVAGAAFVLLLLDLHAAVKASSPMTRRMDNFRNIRYPPDWPLIRIIEICSYTAAPRGPPTAPPLYNFHRILPSQ